MQAFRELSSSRQNGFGSLGYIAAQEVETWARIYGVEDVETLWRHVRAMDLAYVRDWQEKQEREHADQRQHQRKPTA
jgi:hypothetical protein